MTVDYVQTSLNEAFGMRLYRYSSLHLVTDKLEIFNSSVKKRQKDVMLQSASKLSNSLFS